MNHDTSRAPNSVPKNAVSPAAPVPPRVQAATLLAGGRELVIVHQQEEYRLRITKKGKLLLTK